jgi:enamine deaminase RidA (YjgF/YER057c/UK114 family)
MSSLALDIFNRLISQVDEVEAAAARAEADGFAATAPILRRSGFVLAVASIDTYFHEQATRLLTAAALRSATEARTVANYAQSVSANDVSGPSGESHIRMRLSYKTLVSPRNVDAAMTAAGIDMSAVWRDTAFALGTRPDRLRLQLELFYDRRNQIAHEGDWDLIQLDFRKMERAHLEDCTRYASGLSRSIDSLL